MFRILLSFIVLLSSCVKSETTEAKLPTKDAQSTPDANSDSSTNAIDKGRRDAAESTSDSDSDSSISAIDEDRSDAAAFLPSLQEACDSPIESDRDFFPMNEYHCTLESLCAALEAEGPFPCPLDRNAFIQELFDYCGENGSFPWLDRNCGRDTVDFRRPKDNIFGTWSFDALSGKLVAANLFIADFVCGFGNYIGGSNEQSCNDTHSAYCELCIDGPEYNAECPPEIKEVFPIDPCNAADITADCPYQNDDIDSSSFSFPDGIPETGMECTDFANCPPYEDGMCLSVCQCVRDGVFRWIRYCSM